MAAPSSTRCGICLPYRRAFGPKRRRARRERSTPTFSPATNSTSTTSSRRRTPHRPPTASERVHDIPDQDHEIDFGGQREAGVAIEGMDQIADPEGDTRDHE